MREPVVIEGKVWRDECEGECVNYDVSKLGIDDTKPDWWVSLLSDALAPLEGKHVRITIEVLGE